MSNKSFDENLFSRQIYAVGVDAQKKFSESSVLICGMGGLGVEIAKNVILAGIKRVMIQDTLSVTMDDIAAQFYLNETMIGQNRAKSCLSQLVKLNTHISIDAKTDEITDDYVKQFNCVVLTDYRKFSYICHLSEICHQNNIKFIVSDTRGVFGYAFSDFGEKFVSSNLNGERPSRFLIQTISNEEEGIVTCYKSHGLDDSDHVMFEDVEGMTEINGKEFPIKVINHLSFRIGDTRNFGDYVSIKSSGYGNQVIVPSEFHYQKFQDALKNPMSNNKLLIFDYGCMGRDQQVLLFFVALSNAGSLDATYEDVLEEAKKANEKFGIADDIDADLLAKFVTGIKSVISPMCSVFGGIVGQEVLKALSLKFTPLDQFISIGYTEALPSKVEFKPMGDRYDAYRRIFGNAQQEEIQKLSYFLLGAGALGCELLKNMAMIGVATKEDSLITVTDMDSIELSNLSRQFLFHDKDIGKMKSVAASEAVKAMNNDLNIVAHTNKVDKESESIYNKEFFEHISGVCNALDNVETRIYSDKRCHIFKKPLLESGTLGTKANYQVIIPGLTKGYTDQSDPENDDNDIPGCTLHRFPTNINHCCMWAKDKFAGFFDTIPSAVNKFLNEPNYLETLVKEGSYDIATILRIKELMIDLNPKTYEDCARIARGKFENLFVDEINALTKLYPPDAFDEDKDEYVWSRGKHYPTAIEFTSENQEIRDFIKSFADILARIFSIPISGDAMEFAKKGAIKLEDTIDLTSNQEEVYKQLSEDLNTHKSSMRQLNPEEFEKDDDKNGHMDFVAAATNLRAMNYSIKLSSRLEIKRIAGKIIPALATTTAMICGFVTLEMYKVHSIEPKGIEFFRNGFINNGINMYGISQPSPDSNIPTLYGDLTINEIAKEVKEMTNYDAEDILIEDKNIRKEDYDRNVSDILINRYNLKSVVEENPYINLSVFLSNDDIEDFRIQIQ